MRTRSVTYDSLDNCGPDITIIKSAKRRHSLVATNDRYDSMIRAPSQQIIVSNSKNNLSSNGEKLQKWDENEYTAVFKAMNDAILANDQQRFVDLKQELVELEKRAYENQNFDDSKSSDEDDNTFAYSIPSKSTPLLQIDYDAKVNELIKCNTKQYDKRVSVLLLGEHLAGKSVISHIFTERTLRPYQETYGIEQTSVIKSIDNKKIKFLIWDTDANRAHQSIRHVYYAKSNAIMIVFDACNAQSFLAVEYWRGISCSYAKPMYLIATRAEDSDKRVVSHSNAVNYAESHGMKYIEASFKDVLSIDSAFINASAA